MEGVKEKKNQKKRGIKFVGLQRFVWCGGGDHFKLFSLHLQKKKLNKSSIL